MSKEALMKFREAVMGRDYRSHHLNPERIGALNAIGFVWDPIEAVWEERFRELSDYKKIYGHCDVPTSWPENKQLAVWANRQRSKIVPDICGEHYQYHSGFEPRLGTEGASC